MKEVGKLCDVSSILGICVWRINQKTMITSEEESEIIYGVAKRAVKR